jgi:ribosomal protein S27AE
MNRIKSNAFAGCDNVTIYCEAESQPDEFYEDWNSDNLPVVWGYCYHTYESVVIAPTCTEQGYTKHTCSKCGDAYNDNYVDALGHISSDWIIDKEATVEAEGSKHKECTRCGATLETATIPKLDDPNTYLTDENGNVLTDENGNLLTE